MSALVASNHFGKSLTRFSHSLLYRAADGRVTNRRLGHSKRGRIAKTNRYFFHRGRRFSCLGPFALDHGFLSECIIEGAFNSDLFASALVQCVLPFMNPFPGPRSVLLLDNCSIHHTYAVLQACHYAGVLVRFLEPYDPTSMPVEIAFRAMKKWLREKRDLIATLEPRSQIRMAMRAVSRGASRDAFQTAGYL